MAVSLDQAAVPGTAEEATAVVDAVLAASSADELDWIEWKSGLDLSNKAVRGTLARHVLGLANRMPGTAAGRAGGRGFMVVGAEPGDRRGITAADPADLSQGIDAFLGPDRPSWTMHYDDRDGLPVLVLTVAAPRSGDPAFTLFKELEVMSPDGKRKVYPRGTIFVRHQGRTEIARPEDVPPCWSGSRDRSGKPARRLGKARKSPGPGMRQKNATGSGARCSTF